MAKTANMSAIDPSFFSAGLNLMHQFAQTLNAALEPRQLIWEIYRQTRQFIPADVFTLSLLTPNDPDVVDLLAVEHDQVIEERRSIGPLTRWVVEKREPFLTPDDQLIPPPVVPLTIETNIRDKPRTYAFAPLITRGNVVGVLSIQNYTPGTFNEVHLDILSAIASHSAVVLENARLFAAERKRAEELRSLERIGYELAGITELDEVLKEILKEVKTLLRADAASIFVYDERKGQFQQPSFTISPGETEPTQRIKPPRSRGLTIHIVRHRCAIVTGVSSSGEIHFEEIPLGQSIDPDAQHSFAFDDAETAAFLRERGIRSSIGFPLRAGRDMVGALHINYLQVHKFSRDELRSIARLAQHAATAIQRADVYAEIQALHEVGKALTGQIEMQAVIAKLFEYGHATLGADIIVLFSYHAATDMFDMPPLYSGQVYEPDMLANYGDVKSDDVVWQVIRSPEGFFTRNAQTDVHSAGSDIARRPTRFVGREKIASSAGLPLRTEGEGVGVLFFNYRAPQRFGSHQRLLISTFATYAATAIHRAQLMSRRVEELEALAEIDKAITSGDPKEVLEKIIGSACKIVRADCGSILLLDQSGHYLSREVIYSGESQTASGGRYEVDKDGVASWVARHKRSTRIADVHADEWRDIYVEVLPGVRSELAVPILDELNALVGVINLESRAVNAFSQDDERLLTALAEQAYIAIRNQRLFEAERRSREELELLNDIDRAISSALNLTEVLKFIVERSVTLIKAPVFHMMLYDELRGDLYLAAGRGMSAESGNFRLSLDEGITGLAARTRQPQRVTDVTYSPWNTIYPQWETDTRSELAVPLLQDGKLIGVLNLESPDVGAFDEHDQRLLTMLAAQAVIAIQNSRLYESEQRARKMVDILHKVEKAISFLAASRPDDNPIESSHELNMVLQVLLDGGLEAVDAPTGNIMLYDKVQGNLRMAVERGVMSEHRGARQRLGEGIVGLAAQERRTMLVADVTAPPWNEIYMRFISGARSELAVPLVRNDRLIGVLNAESPQVGAFGLGDQQLLEALAGQAVVAYQTAERYQAMQRMRGINQLLASEHDPQHVIQLILEHARVLLKAEWGNLRLYDMEGRPTLDYIVIRPMFSPRGDIQITDLRHTQLDPWIEGDIVAWVALNHQPYRSQGALQADPRYRGRPESSTRSEIAVPLLVEQGLVGVLNLESERQDAFDEEDLNLLIDLSSQAAIAVRNARNLEEVQQTRARFKALKEVGEEIIHAPLDEDAVLPIVLQAGFERTGAFHAVVWQPNREGTSLIASCVEGELTDARHEPVEYGQYVNGRAWKERQLILLEDIDQAVEGIQYRPGDAPAKSLLVVPMIAGDEYYGNLDFRHKEARGFKAEEIELIKGLATQAASAIQRIRRERGLMVILQEQLTKLQDAYRELEFADQQKLEFLAIASHELRTPLTPLHLILERVSLGELSPDELSHELRIAFERTEHLAKLVNRLLDVVRIEAGKVKPEFLHCNVLDLVQGSIRDVQHAVDGNGIRLTTKLFATPISAELDPNMIKQVLDNLLENAVKHTGEGGSISVVCDCEDNEIRIAVSDTGKGIPKDQQKRIFDWFYQVEPSLARSVEGLGLGLYLVRAYVKIHGGEVTVNSEEGKGSTFSVMLPVRQSS